MTDRGLFDIASRRLTVTRLRRRDVSDGAIVIARSRGFDDRGDLALWRELERDKPASVVRIRQTDAHGFSARRGEEDIAVRYRSRESILELIHGSSEVWIDISALGLDVWAPLVEVAHRAIPKVCIVYVEPREYQAHSSPIPAAPFDLSERSRGVEALPRLARLSGPAPGQEMVLVAFLGFEGRRSLYVLSQLDPAPRTIPIVPAPGMQPAYPAQAVLCNREFLDQTASYASIRLADAVCPFQAKQAIEDVVADYGTAYAYVAPLGTKAHALGALLFHLENPGRSQILWDNPEVKAGGTVGVGLVHVFELG